MLFLKQTDLFWPSRSRKAAIQLLIIVIKLYCAASHRALALPMQVLDCQTHKYFARQLHILQTLQRVDRCLILVAIYKDITFLDRMAARHGFEAPPESEQREASDLLKRVDMRPLRQALSELDAVKDSFSPDKKVSAQKRVLVAFNNAIAWASTQASTRCSTIIISLSPRAGKDQRPASNHQRHGGQHGYRLAGWQRPG